MPPIRKGDGTAVAPKGVSQVRTGDGRIFFDGAAIPDSEADQKLAHRWLLDDVNGTVEDSEDDADGTNNGVTSVDGDYAGDSAGEGDGNDNYIETTDWFKDRTTFAVAFSAKTTASDATVMGVTDVTPQEFLVQFGGSYTASSGQLGLVLGGGSGVNRWHMDDAYNDGQIYRFVINRDGDDVDFYVDGSSVSSSQPRDEGGDSTDINNNVWLFARNNEGSIDDPFDGVIDDICFYGDTLTESEIESYRNQWD